MVGCEICGGSCRYKEAVCYTLISHDSGQMTCDSVSFSRFKNTSCFQGVWSLNERRGPFRQLKEAGLKGCSVFLILHLMFLFMGAILNAVH